tara:strand:- start:1985 stop:2914 length:930 start_codon:yes stop_codon:yes gene_type:complete
MQLNLEKVTFGRHETFPLRYSWLTKGFQAINKDRNIFSSEDATVVLGVGKNMVNSIKYWLRAAKIAKQKDKSPSELVPTEIGKSLFGKRGYDPYLEDEATIWLLHWLIATNAELATAFYWFFSRFHKLEFSSQECSSALQEFVREHINTKAPSTTLKNEIAVLLRMYAKSKITPKTSFEDVLDSPLTELKLVTHFSGIRMYQSKQDNREGLPLGILGFAMTELFTHYGENEIPIEDIMYGKNEFSAPGSVFRLSENALLTKLERLINYIPGVYEIRETSGIHQVYKLGTVEAIEYLDKHYKDYSKIAAA